MKGKHPVVINPVFDRHHAAADPQGGGRQDPDFLDRLRPLRIGRRQSVSRGSSTRRRPIGTAPRPSSAMSPMSKAGSTSSRARRSALSISTRLTARSRFRCLQALAPDYGFELKLYPVPASRNAEPELALAQHPPRPARLDLHAGLRRHEPDRGQGSGQDRLPMDHLSASGGPAATTMRVLPAPRPRATVRSTSTRVGTDFPAIQDILKYVVDKGKSQVASKDKVGENFYNRAVLNSVIIAEAIRNGAASDRQEAYQRRRRPPRLRNAQHYRGAVEGNRPGELRVPGQAQLLPTTMATAASRWSQWDGTKWNTTVPSIQPIKDKVLPLIDRRRRGLREGQRRLAEADRALRQVVVADRRG